MTRTSTMPSPVDYVYVLEVCPDLVNSRVCAKFPAQDYFTSENLRQSYLSGAAEFAAKIEDAASALAIKWGAENGDYHESKTDCAEELLNALSSISKGVLHD